MMSAASSGGCQFVEAAGAGSASAGALLLALAFGLVVLRRRA
jgi:MYXO-CTERM domain-containing protein